MLNYIRVKEYFLRADEILYIKEIGVGIRIVCRFGTIDIANIDAAELADIYAKLNFTPLPQKEETVDTTTTPKINCIWTRCIMCSDFCMNNDYSLRPGTVKIRCAKHGLEKHVEEEVIDTFCPDDWEGLR